jgi:hypothetical protein
LPFFVLCTTATIVWIIAGHATVLAVSVACVGMLAIVTIISGRHPRWLQAPMDRWEANRRERRARR